MPHRQATVDAAWRQARAWLRLAYPTVDLDTLPAQLEARFPALAENVQHLRETAEAEAIHFEAEPAATPELFQVAMSAWERATLDACAALATLPPAERVAHA